MIRDIDSRVYSDSAEVKYIFSERDIVIGGASRKEWPNQFQFLCANIAFAVGLGNIWRFPYLAQASLQKSLLKFWCKIKDKKKNRLGVRKINSGSNFTK